MSGFGNRGPQDNLTTSSYTTGPQLFDPSVAALGGGRTYAASLTARAGGGRAVPTKLTAAINQIATCATAGDSVSLPPLINSGAAACQVFAAPGTADTINGVAAATGVSLAAAGKAQFVSPGPGLWFTILSA